MAGGLVLEIVSGYAVLHTARKVNLEVLRVKSLAGSIFSKGKDQRSDLRT